MKHQLHFKGSLPLILLTVSTLFLAFSGSEAFASCKGAAVGRPIAHHRLLDLAKAVVNLDRARRDLGWEWNGRIVDLTRGLSQEERVASPLMPFWELGRELGGFLRFQKLTDGEREKVFNQFAPLGPFYLSTANRYRALSAKTEQLRQVIFALVERDPTSVYRIVHEYQQKISNEAIFNEALDELFGLRFEEVEQAISANSYKGDFVCDGLPRGCLLTHYDWIREIFEKVELSREDVVYDLGSGYGTFLFYGAILRPDVLFAGVELTEERAREAQRVADHLGLKNVKIINKSVLDADFSDGTVFYFFNPFPSIMERVGERLRDLAKKKRVRVAYHYEQNGYFEKASWLSKSKAGSTNVFDSGVLLTEEENSLLGSAPAGREAAIDAAVEKLPNYRSGYSVYWIAKVPWYVFRQYFPGKRLTPNRFAVAETDFSRAYDLAKKKNFNVIFSIKNKSGKNLWRTTGQVIFPRATSFRITRMKEDYGLKIIDLEENEK